MYIEVLSDAANLKTLKCVADANPTAIYRWTNDINDDVVENQQIKLDVNKNITYTCTATNYINGLVYGSISKNITQNQLKSLEERKSVYSWLRQHFISNFIADLTYCIFVLAWIY